AGMLADGDIANDLGALFNERRVRDPGVSPLVRLQHSALPVLQSERLLYGKRGEMWSENRDSLRPYTSLRFVKSAKQLFDLCPFHKLPLSEQIGILFRKGETGLQTVLPAQEKIGLLF